MEPALSGSCVLMHATDIEELRTSALPAAPHTSAVFALQLPGRHDSGPAQGHCQGGAASQASEGRGAAATPQGARCMQHEHSGPGTPAAMGATDPSLANAPFGCWPLQVAGVQVYVADRFGGWHAKVLACLAGMFDEASSSFPADAMQQVRQSAGTWGNGLGWGTGLSLPVKMPGWTAALGWDARHCDTSKPSHAGAGHP